MYISKSFWINKTTHRFNVFIFGYTFYELIMILRATLSLGNPDRERPNNPSLWEMSLDRLKLVPNNMSLSLNM